LLTIATDKLVETRTLTVPAEGTTVDVPIDAGWGAGAYVLATAFRPAASGGDRGPGRAIGVAWLGIDPAARTLEVAIKAPPVIEPRGRVEIPLEVHGLAAGADAYVTLAAVDEGVLQLTDFATPAPQVWYFGKRRLGVEVRDLYGQLIDGRAGRRGEVRSGGDEAALERRGAPPQIKLVALFSGVIKLDAAGHAKVALDVPDYNGRLRLMAVAWDADKVGAAEFGMIVRDPVVAELALPRFLAPGDRSQAAVSLQNVSGPPGIYHLSLTADGPLQLGDGAELSKRLLPNAAATLVVPLLGRSAGEGILTLALDGPGISIKREVRLTVRPAQLATVQRIAGKLDPGQGLTLGEAALAGFLPGTGELLARFSDRPDIDVPGLLAMLERYPYGCIEQTVSRALPLLYLSDVAQSWGVVADPGVAPDEVQRSIKRVLEMQRYDGSFGLWGPRDDAMPWLSAFAMDFLTRARDKGLKVSDTAYANGLKWLTNHSQSYGDDRPDQLASRSYAFYVLARARTGDLGALRYLFDNYGQRVPSGLADAQLGAAFALYGDQQRSAEAFKLALERVERRNREGDDYGSLIRDLAAIATLMLETKGSGQNPAGVLQRVAALQAQSAWLSTQEQAWLLLAAHAAAATEGGGMTLSVDGAQQQRTRPLYVRPSAAELGRGFSIRNAGKSPIYTGQTLIGAPAKDLPALSVGFSLTRQYFALDGTAVKLDKVQQTDLFVVLVKGKMAGDYKRRAMVIDLLPAGFEVENARLAGAHGADSFGWLPELTKTRYSEYLDDRFVAAIDLDPDNREFAVAYLVRAVTPGTYKLPASQVEDMYDPATRARTAAGSVTVRPLK
ncbi:MAG: alpha-2-macroglobulin family protein, partial [Dongiaceae bacterium]